MFRKIISWSMAALVLALSVPQVWADGTPTPEVDHMHMEGTPEVDADHEHGDRIDANGAAIKIVSPADGAVLTENSAIVKVETTNWTLGEGRHFHLYVNGQEQGMSQGTSNSLMARDLKTGDNVLEVVLSNDLHQEFDATHLITVKVAAEGQVPSAPTDSSNSTLVIIAGVAVVVVLGGGAMLLTRKK